LDGIKDWDCGRDKASESRWAAAEDPAARNTFPRDNARTIHAGARNVTGDVAINIETFGA